MNVKIRHTISLWFLILALFPSIVPPASARVLTDQLGRTVTLPDHPQRIVSLAPNITEIIYAIGQEQRLKGVSRFSDYPASAEELPRVGSYVHLDLERIVALDPDLCLATKDGNPKHIIDQLQSLNIPVYAVDPHNLKMVMQTILEIGHLLEASGQAEALVERMRLRINAVKVSVAKSCSRPRVFFQIGISPIVSIGSDTFIHELIVLAGGKNVADTSISYPRFSREQVLAFSPEVFIVTTMARDAVFKKIKAQWSRWPQIPAVRDQRIHLVDSDLFDRPSPRLVEALEILAKLIHPELFGQVP